MSRSPTDESTSLHSSTISALLSGSPFCVWFSFPCWQSRTLITKELPLPDVV